MIINGHLIHKYPPTNGAILSSSMVPTGTHRYPPNHLDVEGPSLKRLFRDLRNTTAGGAMVQSLLFLNHGWNVAVSWYNIMLQSMCFFILWVIINRYIYIYIYVADIVCYSNLIYAVCVVYHLSDPLSSCLRSHDHHQFSHLRTRLRDSSGDSSTIPASH